MAHKNARNDLTAEYVRSILDYDPATGVFTWKWREGIFLGTNRRMAGTRADTPATNGRRRIGINYKRYHRDTAPSNNRWSNLRPATSSQNLCNQRAYANNKSGYKGVSWNTSNNGWIARIQFNGTLRHLGTFDTPEAAYAAYCGAAKNIHGDFARTY